jgi:hypothetical protein
MYIPLYFAAPELDILADIGLGFLPNITSMNRVGSLAY